MQEYPEKTIGIFSQQGGYSMSRDLFVFEAASAEGFTRGELMEVRKTVGRRS
jgi:hypothetical protein